MSSQGISFDPATVIVSWSGSSYNSATIEYSGFGYSQGDVLVYQGTLFGGSTPANDLTLTFTVTATGVLATVNASGAAASANGNFRLTLDNVRASKMNRDASDYTKMLKQRSIYLEKRANSPITNRQSADAWIPQGNQYRIDYLMGKVKCRACVGGAFNLSGAIGFNGVGS
jgi:hypothetical protein